MRVDGQATGEPSRGVHSRRVSRTGPAKAGTRKCSSTPAGAVLEELHVNDLRSEVLPFGFLSSEEVQHGQRSGIDLGLVVLVELPDPPERWLGGPPQQNLVWNRVLAVCLQNR
jgi:hypothetical protein